MTETTKIFEIETYANKVKNDWEVLKKKRAGFFTSNINLSDSVRFFITTLDEAIRFVETKYTEGSDKKTFVLEVLRRVYDTVIASQLPMWLWPFSSAIKSIVIDIIISNAIEYIVNQYNNGSWVKKNELL